MIRLALYVIIYMIPALLTGLIILFIFPHISMGFLVLLNSLVILVPFLKYKDKRVKQFTAEERLNELPDWLKSRSVVVFLSVATLFASFIIFGSNKVNLYIDNASGEDIAVRIAHEGTWLVKANNYTELRVVTGTIQIEYNNKKKLFEINSSGNWVFNIDALNTYFRTAAVYSSKVELYKDGKMNHAGNRRQKPDIIRDEFFDSRCDYLFDVPEKITVKQSRFGSSDVTRMVLYRINGKEFSLDRDELDSEGEENNADPTALEPVILKSKKKKAP